MAVVSEKNKVDEPGYQVGIETLEGETVGEARISDSLAGEFIDWCEENGGMAEFSRGGECRFDDGDVVTVDKGRHGVIARGGGKRIEEAEFYKRMDSGTLRFYEGFRSPTDEVLDLTIR